MVDRISPLAALAAAAPTIAAARLAAPPPLARVTLRTAAPLALPIGQPLNRALIAGDIASLRLGPDEYLLLAPDLAPILAATTGQPAAAVDISHRQTAITLTGPHAADVLNAFCALDLALSAFPPGMCTRTLLAKAEIILWRTASDAFHIEVARSFAPYVWQCLEEGRLEFA